jgi:alanine-glyoxylate transaminase/serine-glyoxylate transaminase/serine-pyruvate transaminase
VTALPDDSPQTPDWGERLFLPGPTPLPWPVATAGARPMAAPHGPAFRALAERVRRGMAACFGTAGAVCAVPASGTGGLEALVQNLFSPGDPVLVVVAGAFGNRFARVAQSAGLDVTRLEVPYGEVPSAAAVRTALSGRTYRGLLFVHNETSTGVLTPAAELAATARAVQPDLLVAADTISGVPSVPLDMDRAGVDAAVAASQKGFMVPPGLCLVALGPRALQQLVDDRPGRFYFNLRPYVEGGFNSTAAVSLWYQMEASLALLEAEPAAERHARHVRMGEVARAGGRAVGMPPLGDARYASPTVTPLAVPEGMTAGQVTAAAGRYGAILARGLGEWSERAIRIGHVGAVTPLDVVSAVAALEAGLLDLFAAAGTPPPFAPGAGVSAAVAAMRGAAGHA